MTIEMKAGGIAALIQALCYICGFAMLATVMNPGDIDGWTQLQKLEFILERQVLFQWWNIIIYVVFGVALVVLAAVLHRRLQSSGSLMMAIATPFGMIWAGLVIASGMVVNVGLSMVSQTYTGDPTAAADAWRIIGAVQDGLGGGVEIVGGVWVLLVSLVSLRSNAAMPKLLSWIGLVVGIAGIVTVIPGLSAVGAVFGLTQIVWFVVLGVVLLRAKDRRSI
ncbi:MAG: hypothetical protein AB8F65_07525 [Woeseiaceae bacterium]